MFMVYTPEGRSFIGDAQNLPALKVDPARRVNKVEDMDVSNFKVDIKGSEKKSTKNEALNAYKKNQNQSKRRLIVKVSEIMTAPVFTIERNTSIEQAWAMMQEYKIKHLPVMNGDNLVGICSQSDLLSRMIVSNQGQLEGVKNESVAQIMKEKVITTSSDTDIRHVAQVLTEFEIDALLIMSDYYQIVGIVTERDLISRLATEPPLELYT